MNIYINSREDIDYSVLHDRINRSKVKTPVLVSNEILNLMTQQIPLTEEQILILNIIKSRQHRTDKVEYPYRKTNSGVPYHENEFLFNKGFTQQSGYKLVEIDLVQCIIQLIQLISGLKDNDMSMYYSDLNLLSEELNDFISGEMKCDSEVHDIMYELINLNNPYLIAYMHKAMELSKKRNVITLDAFQVTRTFDNLTAIEAICAPLAYSLKNLQYILTDRIKEGYRRGEKRFGLVSRFKMYYFVREDKLEEFTTMETYLDGVRLDITYTVKTPSTVNQQIGEKIL